MVLSADQARRLHGEAPETRAIATTISKIEDSIKTNCMQRRCSVIVTIPTWQMGLSAYNVDTVREAVVATFVNAGFQVQPTDLNNTIEIRWGAQDEESGINLPLPAVERDVVVNNVASSSHSQPSSSSASGVYIVRT